VKNLIRQYWKVIIGTALGTTAIALLQVYFSGTNEHSLRHLISWTAKMSVICFSLAFGISSVFHFFKNDVTALIFNYRPHLGLAFAVFHTFHLVFLILLQQYFHPVFNLAKTTSLIGGGMAYILMYMMVFTTFVKGKNMMRPGAWRTLHLVGGYWILLVFIRSYFRQVIYEDSGYILFILVSLVLVFRTLRFFFREKEDIPDSGMML
jgi:hypothetical protein